MRQKIKNQVVVSDITKLISPWILRPTRVREISTTIDHLIYSGVQEKIARVALIRYLR